MRGVDNSFVVVKRPIKFFNIFPSCLRRLHFFGAQKNKGKKGRPCGGLAQRKTFVEIVRQKVACTVGIQ